MILLAVIVALIILVAHHLLSGKKARTGTPAQVVSVAAASLTDMPETLNELGTVSLIGDLGGDWSADRLDEPVKAAAMH